jgi:hypothetical protein
MGLYSAGREVVLAMELGALGRALIVLGVVLVVAGLVLVFAGRVPFLGRLPGDLLIRRDGVTIYIPIVTMLLLSLVLTIILNLIFRSPR